MDVGTLASGYLDRAELTSNCASPDTYAPPPAVMTYLFSLHRRMAHRGTATAEADIVAGATSSRRSHDCDQRR